MTTAVQAESAAVNREHIAAAVVGHLAADAVDADAAAYTWREMTRAALDSAWKQLGATISEQGRQIASKDRRLAAFYEKDDIARKDGLLRKLVPGDALIALTGGPLVSVAALRLALKIESLGFTLSSDAGGTIRISPADRVPADVRLDVEAYADDISAVALYLTPPKEESTMKNIAADDQVVVLKGGFTPRIGALRIVLELENLGCTFDVDERGLWITPPPLPGSPWIAKIRQHRDDIAKIVQYRCPESELPR